MSPTVLVCWELGGFWDVGCFVIKLIRLGAPGADDLLNFDPSFSPALLLASRILPSTSFCMLEIFPVTNRWWKGTGEGVGLERQVYGSGPRSALVEPRK